MKTKFQLTTFVLSILVLSSTILFGEEEQKIKSLDDAKTVAEVREYIQNVQTQIPQPEPEKLQQDVGEAYLRIGEKLITSDNKQQQEEGVKIKIYALHILSPVNSATTPSNEFDETKNANLENYLNELEKEGKFPDVVNQERYVSKFLQKIHLDLKNNFNLSDFAVLVQESKKWANTKLANIKPSSVFITIIEAASFSTAKELDPMLVGKTYDEIITFIHSDKFNATENEKDETVKRLESFRKRLQGSDLELYGRTLDDKVFNWNNFRGKYVLVNFTASWCGPCKREIPFILEAYEKYHDNGFDVISVYIWDKLEDSKKAVEEEKLPWIILSEELTEKADLPKQSIVYVIQGVPTVLLIDKEGKIISTGADVRGANLDETLHKLFNEQNDK
jgi:thiol-disulfide isomerase/thioredoxin